MSESNLNLNSTPDDKPNLRQSEGLHTEDQLDAIDDIDEMVDQDDSDNYYEEDWDDNEEKTGRRKPRTVQLFCFECNRQETHFLGHRRRWYYSLLLGLTFGLILLFGPFKCRCCGKSRFMCADWLHPKKWFPPKAAM